MKSAIKQFQQLNLPILSDMDRLLADMDLEAELKRMFPLSPGNTRLGRLIWHFSMPAYLTCPGASDACEECYAAAGHYKGSTVARALVLRMHLRHRDDFVKRVLRQIRTEGLDKVRIHASGDFDSVAYIRKWIKIVKSAPDTNFYAYTRSWSVDSLVPALLELAELKNFDMWWSFDHSMPIPFTHPGVRRAYLSLSDSDLPPEPVDLVFRDKRKTKQVVMGDTYVCPKERHPSSHKTNVPVTCQTCQFCFGKRTAALDQRNQAIRKQLPVLEGV